MAWRPFSGRTPCARSVGALFTSREDEHTLEDDGVEADDVGRAPIRLAPAETQGRARPASLTLHAYFTLFSCVRICHFPA